MEGNSQKTKIILMAVVHNDPEGEEILLSAFYDLKPDMISLEFSMYGLWFRLRHGEKIRDKIKSILYLLKNQEELNDSSYFSRKNKTIQFLLSYIDLPYEYRATKRFATKNSVPYYLVDNSFYSRNRIQIFKKEAINKDSIKFLLEMNSDHAQEVRNCYLWAYRSFSQIEHSDILLEVQRSSEMDMRDREMAKKIRALINKHSPVCFVHVGGWEHFVSIKGRNTLFSELRDLNPQIMLLRNF